MNLTSSTVFRAVWLNRRTPACFLVILGGCTTGESSHVMDRPQAPSEAECGIQETHPLSLTYSDVTRSLETYDESGVEISLHRMTGEWTGTVRTADGERGEAKPLVFLEVDTAKQQIFFGFSTGADTAKFSGRLSCDALSGELILYRTVIIPDKLYLRVR